MSSSSQTVSQFLATLWQFPWIRIVIYGLLLYIAFLLAKQLVGVLLIVAVSYALSYMFNPLLIWLDGRGVRRGISVTVIVLSFLIGIAFLTWMAANQFTNFITNIPVLLDQLPDSLEKWLSTHQNIPGVPQVQERLMGYIHSKIDHLIHNIGPITAEVFHPNSFIMDRLLGALGWLGQAMFVLTLTIFFMLDHTRLGKMLLSLLPVRWRKRAKIISEDISHSFGAYIRGQLITGIAISLIAAIGLLILGIPNAFALALITGVVALIPLIGIVIATIPVALQATSISTMAVVSVCVLYFLINQIAFNIVQPHVIGRDSHMHPAGILVSVLVGASLAGFWGAMLAIPFALLIQRWVIRYWLDSPAHAGE